MRISPSLCCIETSFGAEVHSKTGERESNECLLYLLIALMEKFTVSTDESFPSFALFVFTSFVNMNISDSLLRLVCNQVGFYSRKAGYLKKVAGVCNEKYDGDIPSTLQELLSLPGIGPKMAHLVSSSR